MDVNNNNSSASTAPIQNVARARNSPKTSGSASQTAKEKAKRAKGTGTRKYRQKRTVTDSAVDSLIRAIAETDARREIESDGTESRGATPPPTAPPQDEPAIQVGHVAGAVEKKDYFFTTYPEPLLSSRVLLVIYAAVIAFSRNFICPSEHELRLLLLSDDWWVMYLWIALFLVITVMFPLMLWSIRRQRVVHVGCIDESDGELDGRGDMDSLSKLKHKKAVYAHCGFGYAYCLYFKWIEHHLMGRNTSLLTWDPILRTKYECNLSVTVELELLTQLASPVVIANNSDLKTTWNRINTITKTLHTTNYDRKQLFDFQLIKQNTALCMQWIAAARSSRLAASGFLPDLTL
jgi:hypothetical protein